MRTTPADEAKPRVEIDTAGFRILEAERICARVEWSKVLEVFAYKEDLWDYDEILVGFRIHEDGTIAAVSEECAGYQALLDSLGQFLPGIRTDWFSEVAFPAFALNMTTLWTKQGSA